jgi:hypothetical protein
MQFRHMGKACLVASIAVCATILEIYDKPAGGLWLIVVCFAIFGDWSASCDCEQHDAD